METLDLTVIQAKDTDWNEILNLLEETDLTIWFTGKESSKDFFIVRDPDTRRLICCFSIIKEDDLGILKSFAVRKELQGKGIGKYITLKMFEVNKKFGIKKLFAASEDPVYKFWLKNNFKEIKYSEIEERFFYNYVDPFKNKIKNYFDFAHFLLFEL